MPSHLQKGTSKSNKKEWHNVSDVEKSSMGIIPSKRKISEGCTSNTRDNNNDRYKVNERKRQFSTHGVIHITVFVQSVITDTNTDRANILAHLQKLLFSAVLG